MTEKNKGGRPKYEPTEENKELVAKLAGGGMSHEGIATVLGIARQTLETYYPVELTVSAYQHRAEVLSAMLAAAKAGSVAAAKFYMQHEPQGAPEAQTQAVGKKEQANAEAKTADKGTDWEGLLAPMTRQ